MPKQTQLYEWHKERAQMVEFAGYMMPIMYKSIKEEHLAVRNKAGLFDVSHMNRMLVTGNDSTSFLNYILPRNIEKVAIGNCAYTMALNEIAGIKDDLVVVRLAEERYIVVWNASNYEKILNWFKTIKELISKYGTIDVHLEDISDDSAMFAIQGPLAIKILEKTFGSDLPGRWRYKKFNIKGTDVLITGTGYTGENGAEITVFNTSATQPDNAIKIWELLLENGMDEGIIACGLGARDSLRMEAGYCLYGNDIDEQTGPVEADLFFPPFIHMDKLFFVGKTMLEKKANNTSITRIGFMCEKRGASPRRGTHLIDSSDKVKGNVTSGGFSPLLNKGIGFAYVDKSVSEPGTELYAIIRDKKVKVNVSKFPLFDDKKYGLKREL